MLYVHTVFFLCFFEDIFCRIYVIYLPFSRFLDNAWYNAKLLVNSEYRGSR